MRDITLGQFVAGNSVIHRLDPRTKIAMMILYIAMTFLVRDIWFLSIPFVYLVLELLLSRISLRYIWNSLKPIRLLLIFMFLLNLFFTKGEYVLFGIDLGFWKLTKEALLQSFFLMIRIILLVVFYKFHSQSVIFLIILPPEINYNTTLEICTIFSYYISNRLINS